MDSIVIHGGNRLNGQIEVSGAKNSAIKLMAASILTDQPLLLTNMPRLADTRFLGQLLQQFGVEVTERPELAMIAVQGPNARAKVLDLLSADTAPAAAGKRGKATLRLSRS